MPSPPRRPSSTHQRTSCSDFRPTLFPPPSPFQSTVSDSAATNDEIDAVRPAECVHRQAGRPTLGLDGSQILGCCVRCVPSKPVPGCPRMPARAHPRGRQDTRTLYAQQLVVRAPLRGGPQWLQSHMSCTPPEHHSGHPWVTRQPLRRVQINPRLLHLLVTHVLAACPRRGTRPLGH